MADKNDKDQLSGVETTGHEWDGIKELNNPLPRWWLWVFYATIIWGIAYMVFYPSLPILSGEGERGGTKGTLEWTQYKKLEADRKEILARRAGYLERFHDASFGEIMKDEELFAFAMAGGSAAFKDNCATCHGTGGAGAPGYPNLNDDDWIWGGDMASIYETIKYGIRMHEDSHQSTMPAYEGILDDDQIRSVAEYIQGLHSVSSQKLSEDDLDDIDEDDFADLPQGMRVFAEQCASCHGYDGKGMREFGAPNLADAIWLKNEGNLASIISQIKAPKHGMMPAWVDRLDDDTIRQLTIYVHSLGGGE